jgi:putative flippase GtrA
VTEVKSDALAASPKKTWSELLHSRPIKFLLVGGFAAGVNFLSRILLGIWMPYVPSIVLAYLLGMATAFVMNRLFVFSDAKNALHHQIFWFVAVNLAAVVQTIAVSVFLAGVVFPYIGFTWHPETVAHAFGVLIPVVTSYIGHKHLSFKGSTDA